MSHTNPASPTKELYCSLVWVEAPKNPSKHDKHSRPGVVCKLGAWQRQFICFQRPNVDDEQPCFAYTLAPCFGILLMARIPKACERSQPCVCRQSKSKFALMRQQLLAFTAVNMEATGVRAGHSKSSTPHWNAAYNSKSFASASDFGQKIVHSDALFNASMPRQRQSNRYVVSQTG